jgi:hypothetical protein
MIARGSRSCQHPADAETASLRSLTLPPRDKRRLFLYLVTFGLKLQETGANVPAGMAQDRIGPCP